MIDIQNEKDCCGCGACAQVCPKGCISFTEGTLGAKISHADSSFCIHCGACDRVCPIQNSVPLKKPFARYSAAAICNDPALRALGSSGGVFPAAAKKALADGYIVYGAAFDTDLRLKCTAVTTVEALPALCKSKYLQSDLSESFDTICAQLEAGKKILFVSTPCQVAALKLFLKKDYPNLLAVDFFCHGVPSQAFFDECLRYEDVRYRRKTVGYAFRTKVKHGKTPHYYTVRYVNKRGKTIEKTGYYFDSAFYAAFQQYVTLRESCYACRFAGGERYSDLTIGDFHGIDAYVSGINRFDGVSTVIINSEAGEAFWHSILPSFSCYPLDMEMLIGKKEIFSGPTPRPKHRDAFAEEYRGGGIDAVYGRYLKKTRYIKQRVYYSLPDVVRNQVKKRMGLGEE